MVSRRSRIIDAVSLALILAGGFCFSAAYVGMQRLRSAAHDPNAPIFAGYTRYVRLTQLSYLGIAAMAVGIVVAIYAALHARSEAARASDAPRSG